MYQKHAHVDQLWLDQEYACSKQPMFSTARYCLGEYHCQTIPLKWEPVPICRRCLWGAVTNLFKSYGGKKGGRVLYPSCNIRYEFFLFYHLWSWMQLEGCRTGVWRGYPRVGATFGLFCFFFFLFFLFFFSRIHADSAWFAPICAESSRFGQNRVVSASDRIGWNRPTSASNHAGIAEIGFEWGPNILNLSFLNFILNICCFFCVFFFVLCFLSSSFFVLWIKA